MTGSSLGVESARAIRNRLQLFGFLNVTAGQVLDVAKGESLGDAALEGAILQELGPYEAPEPK